MKDLRDLLDELRAQGVTHYRAGEFELRLSPPRSVAEALTPMVELDMCACGHEQAEHASGTGLCSHACDPESCVGKVKE